jgi:hypothetical protein
MCGSKSENTTVMTLQKVPILARSGVNEAKILGKIPPLRSGYYRLLNQSIGGDAPKDFLQVYQYGSGRKVNSSSWPKYIAKVGHKWYPMESITEHLLNEIGNVLGLRMARSQLRMAHGQLRFLSRFFLEPDQSLTHGAEIYSAYLGEQDHRFVDEIEKQNLSREWLTFQFTMRSLRHSFKSKTDPIIQDFVRMQIFDALVGNNDRHFYNWGVVEDITHKKDPFFAPIYDTARGLFWNFPEKKVVRMFTHLGEIDRVQLHKYADRSMPKIGWETIERVTHFEIVRRIHQNYPEFQALFGEIISQEKLQNVLTLLQTSFKPYFPPQRLILIQECLIYRFNKINQAIS